MTKFLSLKISMFHNIFRGVLFLFCSLSIAPSIFAAELILEATFSTQILNGWEQVERWKDNNNSLNQESFPSDGRGNQTGQRVTFFGGNAAPHSSQFLIYSAPNWDSNSKAIPVLLIHGANQDADIAWANPNEAGNYGCGQMTCPNTGLMQQLVNDNFKVFALSFAHKNGDGYFWAEQIANAIEIVKEKTGASKVNLVTWSKSAFNARMYISSVTESWGTSYRGDVNRLIMLGAPNNGIDWSFRHGTSHTYSVYPECGGTINGPTAHDSILCYGVWHNEPLWTYSSLYFPGSAQMLKRWDSTYGLSILEPDWYTTYHGGWGNYSHALGIDAYLTESIVDEVRAVGTPADVTVHNLCGDQADIALIHNEHTGSSDGVVFVASCNNNTGISNDAGSSVISVNHLQLGWSTLAVSKIKTWLNMP